MDKYYYLKNYQTITTRGIERSKITHNPAPLTPSHVLQYLHPLGPQTRSTKPTSEGDEPELLLLAQSSHLLVALVERCLRGGEQVGGREDLVEEWRLLLQIALDHVPAKGLREMSELMNSLVGIKNTLKL